VIYLWFRLGRLQARLAPETCHEELRKIGMISKASIMVEMGTMVIFLSLLLPDLFAFVTSFCLGR
jgi:hypothetical protein